MSGTAAVLARIVERLDGAGIAHMIAGSIASSVHGRPRTTQDIDIVIDADEAGVAAFVASLSADEWYVDADAAKDAARRRSLFNVVDLVTGWKIDLVVRKTRAFSVEEFARRELRSVLGVSVRVASAEDTIVTKLEWSKMSGGSERQRRDVRGILELRRATLDLAYVGWRTNVADDDLDVSGKLTRPLAFARHHAHRRGRIARYESGDDLAPERPGSSRDEDHRSPS